MCHSRGCLSNLVLLKEFHLQKFTTCVFRLLKVWKIHLMIESKAYQMQHIFGEAFEAQIELMPVRQLQKIHADQLLQAIGQNWIKGGGGRGLWCCITILLVDNSHKCRHLPDFHWTTEKIPLAFSLQCKIVSTCLCLGNPFGMANSKTTFIMTVTFVMNFLLTLLILDMEWESIALLWWWKIKQTHFTYIRVQAAWQNGLTPTYIAQTSARLPN